VALAPVITVWVLFLFRPGGDITTVIHFIDFITITIAVLDVPTFVRYRRYPKHLTYVFQFVSTTVRPITDIRRLITVLVITFVMVAVRDIRRLITVFVIAFVLVAGP
jgi:FlaA1/EpsC-like NDP-sugar epimerase